MKSENSFSLEGLAKLANLANYSPEPTYHGLTLSELEAEAANDWQEMQNDPGQLEAFAHALKTTRTRQQGEKARPLHKGGRLRRMRPCVVVGRCVGQSTGLPVVPEQRPCAAPWLGIMSGL